MKIGMIISLACVGFLWLYMDKEKVSPLPDNKEGIVTPDPKIQEKIEFICSRSSKEEAKKAIDELKSMVSKDTAALVPQVLYYRRFSLLPPMPSRQREEKAWITVYILAEILPNTDRDSLAEALAPCLKTDDEEWVQSTCEVLGSLFYDKKNGQWDFTPAVPALRKRRDKPPMEFIDYLFKSSPVTTLSALISAYGAKGDTFKDVEEFGKQVDKALAKYSSEWDKEPDTKLSSQLDDYSRHQEWCVRLFVALAIRDMPKYQTKTIMERLKKDAHSLVRETVQLKEEKEDK